jgi:hypothetical protein
MELLVGENPEITLKLIQTICQARIWNFLQSKLID